MENSLKPATSGVRRSKKFGNVDRELEDELVAFSTVGYLGDRSPNRADALIWGLTELFPGIVAPRKEKKPAKPYQPPQSWMAA